MPEVLDGGDSEVIRGSIDIENHAETETVRYVNKTFCTLVAKQCQIAPNLDVKTM